MHWRFMDFMLNVADKGDIEAERASVSSFLLQWHRYQI